jgi:hypothetical protein
MFLPPDCRRRLRSRKRRPACMGVRFHITVSALVRAERAHQHHPSVAPLSEIFPSRRVSAIPPMSLLLDGDRTLLPRCGIQQTRVPPCASCPRTTGSKAILPPPPAIKTEVRSGIHWTMVSIGTKELFDVVLSSASPTASGYRFFKGVARIGVSPPAAPPAAIPYLRDEQLQVPT